MSIWYGVIFISFSKTYERGPLPQTQTWTSLNTFPDDPGHRYEVCLQSPGQWLKVSGQWLKDRRQTHSPSNVPSISTFLHFLSSNISKFHLEASLNKRKLIHLGQHTFLHHHIWFTNSAIKTSILINTVWWPLSTHACLGLCVAWDLPKTTSCLRHKCRWRMLLRWCLDNMELTGNSQERNGR